MSKKLVFLKMAQFNVTFIVILSVIITGILIIFGYDIIKSNIGRQCTANLDLFQDNIQGVIGSTAHKYGSIEEYEYKALCGINRAYFVDKDKDIDVTEFNEIPEIKADIDSDSKNNLFLMADNKLERALYTGNIDIPNPHYLCFTVNNGILNMLLEGKGSSTRLKHKDNMFNCGHTIIELSVEDVGIILDDAANSPDLQAALAELQEDPVDLFSTTESEVELSRDVSCEGQDALVEIEIVPKEDKELRDFRYMEWIPKSCVEGESLVRGSTLILGTGDYNIIVKGDPLLMWKFNREIEDKKEISYTIPDKCDTMLDCEILGLGFAESIGRITNLNAAREFGSTSPTHSSGGNNMLDEIKKIDEQSASIDSDEVLHIETEDELEEGDKIIVKAYCTETAYIYLREERSIHVLGDIAATERCIDRETKSFAFTLPEDTQESKLWDITSTGTVKFDFITSETD